MNGCIFCEVAQGKQPAKVVWEDQDHLAFLDIRPQRAGHTLVIPKAHVATFMDMGDEAFGRLMQQSKKLAEGLRKASGAPLVFLQLIGKDIPHVHVHLIPESFNGYNKDDFGAIGQKIKEVL
jgi:histidine triad (HIT) family protein